MIVDASVVVKWFTLEPQHEQARGLLLRDHELLAPDLVAVEVANALWVKTVRGELAEGEAVRAVGAVSGSGEPQLRPTVPLLPSALALARRLQHPVYDCVYLALAEQLDVPLITADQRFAAAAAVAGDRVRLLE